MPSIQGLGRHYDALFFLVFDMNLYDNEVCFLSHNCYGSRRTKDLTNRFVPVLGLNGASQIIVILV